jgi:plasminogen activator inhibitor 1 RNA-binding protein
VDLRFADSNVSESRGGFRGRGRGGDGRGRGREGRGRGRGGARSNNAPVDLGSFPELGTV